MLGNDKASFALAVGDKEFNPGQVLASDCCTFERVVFGELVDKAIDLGSFFRQRVIDLLE